jgi:hypothetical protein
MSVEYVSGFRFRLYSEEWDELGGYESIVPNWSHGGEFVLGDGRRFRIIGIVGMDDDVGVFNAALDSRARRPLRRAALSNVGCLALRSLRALPERRRPPVSGRERRAS